MFISSFSIVHSVKLSHSVNFKSPAIINLLTAVLSGIVGIYMAYKGWGVWSLVIQQFVATLIRTILLMVVTHWSPKLVFSQDSFRYLFGFGSKILASSLLHTIYSNLTTMIIGKFYSAKDLGFYTRGQSLAAFPSSNVTSIVQSVTYPVLSKIQDDDKHLIDSYRKLISMTSMVIFFGMLLLAALAKPLILTVLTDKWQNAAIYLQVFCFAYMFDHLCSLNLNILYVKGFSNLVLRLEIIKKSISISMIIAAVPLGPLAICIASAIYTQIAVIINTYYTGKLFGLGYLKQIKDFIKYLICSILAVLPTYLMTYVNIQNILQIIIGASLSCIIYCVLLRKDNSLIELYSIVKNNLLSK